MPPSSPIAASRASSIILEKPAASKPPSMIGNDADRPPADRPKRRSSARTLSVEPPRVRMKSLTILACTKTSKSRPSQGTTARDSS
jgi:hypothetical protein